MMSSRRSRSSPQRDHQVPGARSAGSNRRVSSAKFSAYRPISQPKRLIRGMRSTRVRTGAMARCYTFGEDLEHLAVEPEDLQHAAGDLLDRRMRGAQRLDALGLQQGLRGGDFALAGIEFRVARIRAPFLADLVQALRIDGQAEQLVPVRSQ